MPVGPARMPLLDHLGELRVRLMRIVIVLAVSVCVFYLAAGTVAHFLLQPVAEYLPKTESGDPALAILGVFDAFSVRFMVALFASFVACAPIVIWQILAFFLPALKPEERKWFIPTVAAGIFLFIFGTVFCYLIILNPAFQWLTDQAAGLGNIFPEVRTYLDTVMKFEICFGFAFELPLIVFYLVLFNIVPYKRLRKSWRFVYIALMLISAMATPDASPITMALMFAAMVGLYEASLLFARVALRKRVKQQEAQAAAEEEADLAELARG